MIQIWMQTDLGHVITAFWVAVQCTMVRTTECPSSFYVQAVFTTTIRLRLQFDRATTIRRLRDDSRLTRCGLLPCGVNKNRS